MRYRRTRAIVAALLLLLLGGCSAGSLDEIRRAEDLRVRDSETLFAAVAGGDLEQRRAAVRAMGRIQGAEYANVLAGVASTATRPLRLEALFALGQLGLAEGATPPAGARETLTQALEDPDPVVVAAATEALGKLAPAGAAGALVPLLRHDDAAVRREAAHALFRQRFVPVWRKQSEDPPELPGFAVEALIVALDDRDAQVRRAAAHAFSRYGQPAAVTALTDRLEDTDVWVRVFAARAIGRSGDPAVAEALQSALDDPDLHVRSEAVTALTRLDAVDSLPFDDLVRDPSFHVRAALAGALGQSADPRTLETLAELESDRSVTVRATALQATTERLGNDHAEALRRALDAPEWPVRVAAARAAAAAGGSATALIEQALRDPDVRVRTAALESAEEVTPGALVVQQMLSSPDPALRGTALALYAGRNENVDPDLLAVVYDASEGEEWIEIREGIADALAGDSAAEPLLRRMAARDPAPSVRSRARLALGIDHDPEPPIDLPARQPSPLLDRAFIEDPIVVLETTKGEMTLRCLASDAPLHVASFVDRVRAGFYDGLAWHRVVPNFVIQGGDPRGDGWGGDGSTLRDEINPTRYTRGAVGMPKAGKDTGSCQIFITHLPTPHLDGNYTVFALVESGLDVIDQIEVGDRILRAYLP